jgi:hypothetical protein
LCLTRTVNSWVRLFHARRSMPRRSFHHAHCGRMHNAPCCCPSMSGLWPPHITVSEFFYYCCRLMQSRGPGAYVGRSRPWLGIMCQQGEGGLVELLRFLPRGVVTVTYAPHARTRALSLPQGFMHLLSGTPRRCVHTTQRRRPQEWRQYLGMATGLR